MYKIYDEQDKINFFYSLPHNAVTTSDVVAAVLGVSQGALYKQRTQNKGIPFKKVNKRFLYKKADVLTYIENEGFKSDKDLKKEEENFNLDEIGGELYALLKNYMYKSINLLCQNSTDYKILQTDQKRDFISYLALRAAKELVTDTIITRVGKNNRLSHAKQLAKLVEEKVYSYEQH